jgi:GNAT superfamily N-acetyltransferase
MVVRPAGDHDIDAIGDVFVASFGGLPFLPKLHTEDETRAWIRNVMVPGHEVWVADGPRGVVGFAAIHDDSLGHLYVHPGAQRQGVGTALLAVVKRERPAGFLLWTFQPNDGARRFYERHGLRAIAFGDGSGNEEGVPDVQYEWAPYDAM